MSAPRGIRLNNPTNIKRVKGQTWIGQAPAQSDAVFVEFISPEYCYRASTRIIMGHFEAGKTTTADVCSHWAPPSENDTKDYIAAVEKRTGFAGPLVLPAQLPALLHAITCQEEGSCPYEDSVIVAGIELDGVHLVTQNVPEEVASPKEAPLAMAPAAESIPPAATDPAPPLVMHILRSNVVRGALVIAVSHALAYFKITSGMLEHLGLSTDTGVLVDAAIDWIGTYGGTAYIIIARYVQKAAPALVFTNPPPLSNHR